MGIVSGLGFPGDIALGPKMGRDLDLDAVMLAGKRVSCARRTR